MKFILHTGSYKTGTSCLQSTLYEAREKLLNAKCLYPMAGLRQNLTSNSKMSRAHHQYFHTQRGRNKAKFEQLFDKLKDEIDVAKPETIILSTELFTGCPKIFKKKVIDQINDISSDITILYAVRPPAEYALSMAKQQITKTLDFDYGDIKKIKLASDSDLMDWADLVGSENINARLYDSFSRKNFLFELLAPMIGNAIASQLPFSKKTENDSVDFHYLLLARQLKHKIQKCSLLPLPLSGSKMVRMVYLLLHKHTQQLGLPMIPIELSASQMHEITINSFQYCERILPYLTADESARLMSFSDGSLRPNITKLTIDPATLYSIINDEADLIMSELAISGCRRSRSA